ncbi:hypothetical protein GCK72_010472 [Caenorhabditis remanei]|uniref:Uncharacterized protein n=1 Tax=Caenorhabditis remanei TaxID=31234 RepID=A0A6A5H2Z2_CAERE|nr:hypothetical protein GCK72_010472 [Caenorhabditis remanei]KAF1762210.1 hypothetical protein GCK72_010472 [Caenorhabditis remanei]
MPEQETKKLEGLVKQIKTEINAKKAILEEVLRTVDKDQDKSSSVKKRVYIREILNCEVSMPCSINEIFCADLIESFRFETHFVARFKIRNTSEGDFSHQSAVLCVSASFSAFFDDEKISLSIHGKIIQAQSQIFNSPFRLLIECNQTAAAPPEACISELISIAEATEDLDLKAIEYMDEKSTFEVILSHI